MFHLDLTPGQYAAFFSSLHDVIRGNTGHTIVFLLHTIIFFLKLWNQFIYPIPVSLRFSCRLINTLYRVVIF